MRDHDPEVTPEQEARLRRLLAQARHGEPVPVDVVARLDRVLEQLAAEEPDPHAGRSVVDLTARRRRRVRTLLVAAAAVVVVGVGVGQVTGRGQDDLSSADSAATGSDTSAGSAEAATSAESDGMSALGDSPQDNQDSDGGSGDSSFSTQQNLAPSTRSGAENTPHAPVQLTEDAFAKQAVRLRDRPGVESSAGAVVPDEALSRSEMFVCDTAPWGEGRLLAALYDGVPAVLAYRPVAGDTQTVDLLRCGTGEVLRSTVLPVEG